MPRSPTGPAIWCLSLTPLWTGEVWSQDFPKTPRINASECEEQGLSCSTVYSGRPLTRGPARSTRAVLALPLNRRDVLDGGCERKKSQWSHPVLHWVPLREQQWGERGCPRLPLWLAWGLGIGKHFLQIFLLD